jgi:ribosome biogenesis SPOUT family RNA methylase Rps3
MEKIFVIEHLEPELWSWCIIEYKHISKIVGRKNLWFTNIKPKDSKELEKFGKVINKSVKSLDLKDSCILDPESQVTLTPENSRPFKYFIFGGILGDYPPKKRTKQELSKLLENVSIFNIGKEQMSTDNAAFTTKKIIEGKKISELRFQDNVEIKIDKVMSTSLPYRYNLINGKPLISSELKKFIIKRDKIY